MVRRFSAILVDFDSTKVSSRVRLELTKSARKGASDTSTLAGLLARYLFGAGASSDNNASFPLLPLLRVPEESTSGIGTVAARLPRESARGRRVQLLDPMKFRYDLPGGTLFRLSPYDLTLGIQQLTQVQRRFGVAK